MNPNMGWAEPPSAAAFGSPAGAMGQLAGATPGASAVPSGNTMSGWPGTGSATAGGNVNPGWVAPSGNASTWGGDQNRRGSGGAQWNRQSSFGGGGGGGPSTPRGQGVCKFHENGHCKKGAACNYMHT
uniref:C3H1-type domain-containing protein n=1 Tax=Opuntia streptacantha TaxID=393608 RepID=A0A7C9AW40_OPUST